MRSRALLATAPPATATLGSRDRKRVLADDAPVVYEPLSTSPGSGHLLFVRDTTLVAQPFDADRLELGGEAVPVAEELPVAPTVRKAPFSVAGGTLVYRGAGTQVSQLVWVDRTGTDLGKVAGPDAYKGHRLSPNARQIAMTVFDRRTLRADLWIFDLARGVRTRLTSDPGDVQNPVWSPDGTRLAFNSSRSGAWNVYTRELTAGATEELLFKLEHGNTYLQQWSSDGRWLLFSAGDFMTRMHLWALPLDSRKPVPAVPAEFNEEQGRLSPDTRWIAYTSDESGAREIYLQRFPSSGRKLRVSVAGGREPQWRGDGEELFFIAGDGTLMAAPIRGKETLEVGTTRALFNLGPQRATSFAQGGMTSLYDVTRDGERFLVDRLVDVNARSALTVVLDWTAALKR